jgi:hypothetical protein
VWAKFKPLMINQKVRRVTTVPERIEDGGNNGSFEVDDFTIASLRTMRLHIKKATECFVKRQFQHTCQASNPRLLKGNNQIKLHYQTYLRKKAQQNDIRFIVF